VVTAHGVVALALLLRALFGHLAVAWLLHRAGPAPAAARRLFRGMSQNLRPRPRLVVSPRVRGPVCCGLLRPTVVLPVELAYTADRDRLRWVFAHELAHLDRRDPWAGLAVCLAQVLYFHLPWFWWLRRQVRLCQEYVADAAAAGPATPVEEYAAFLVSLSGAPAVPLGTTGVLGHSSDLYRRVTMLLKNPGRAARRGRRGWSLAAAGTLVLGAVCLSGLGVRADEAPKNDPPAAKDRTGDDAADVKVFRFRTDEERERAARLAADARRLAHAYREEALRRALARAARVQEDDPKDKAKDKAKETPKDKPRRNLPDQDALQKQMKQLIEQLEKDWDKNGLPKEALDELKKSLDGLTKMDGLPKTPVIVTPFFPGEFARFQAPGGFGAMGGFAFGSGRLGAQVQTPSATLVEQLDLPKDQGLVLTQVLPDSAAAKAGLKSNDILLEFAGKPVSSQPGEFVRQLRDVKADQAVDAVVLRKGRKETVKGVKLPEAKAAADFPGDVWGAVDPRAMVPALPKMPAVPPVPAVPAFPRGPGGAFTPAVPRGFGIGNSMSVTVNNGDFTIESKQDNVSITVKGRANGANKEIQSIEVQDGGTTYKANKLSGVPEKYRDAIKKLLDHVQAESRGPAGDVRGRVLRADGESGLVTISIGADTGVAPGHTLEVFRLAPEPLYLGQASVVRVQPKEAVARFTPVRRNVTVVTGDEVGQVTPRDR
jgi:hypothetical protein